MNHNKTPLLRGVLDYVKTEPTCFDVPGHKMGKGITHLPDLWGEMVLKMDINSSPAVDNLANPKSIIKEAEVLLADAYGAEFAYMLVNGSTSGVIAMIMSAISFGDKIILPRNVHKSAINALILSGGIPVFIDSEIDEQLGISNGVTLSKIAHALDLNPTVKAVFVLHPTYFGVTSNLKSIIKFCHERGIAVLVDMAHGAHFGFSEYTPVNPARLGADLVTTSMHKTGGALTQTSIILQNTGLITKEKVRCAINLLQTTSASYLLMCSIDEARRMLVIEGKERLDALYKIAAKAKAEINRMNGLSCLMREEYVEAKGVFDFDDLKMVISVKELSVSGFFVYALLKEKYNIQIELAEPFVILAIISFGDTEQTVNKLVTALANISELYYKKDKGSKNTIHFNEFPKTILSPRDAYYYAKKEVDIRQAVGQICGEVVMIYPPGIPIIIPGEKINRKLIDYFLYLMQESVMILKDSEVVENILIIDKNLEENSMDLWYTENHQNDTKFSIQVSEHIHTEKSEFQEIDFFKSKTFGTFFTLDGLMMVTEKDEFIYHDMIVHVPMAVNPDVKKVLIIGGGDGGTAREVLRYSSVEQVDMVEIDERVVRLCQKYLQQTACKLDNDVRLKMYFEDGLKFVQECADNSYDLILVDSTDPIGPGEGLFTYAFYNNCKRILTKNGILINQHESPYYESYAHEMRRSSKKIRETFPIAKVYQFHMPTYPSGHWLFGFASKELDPIVDLKADKWNSLGLKTKYYNTNLHVGSFMLPTYVIEMLEDTANV
nr:polyamine aminopropyltransferase [Candidatus Epulopiscium viviparus]